MREQWQSARDHIGYMHASLQATLYNANFETDGAPYLPEDFMGNGDRSKRQLQARKDRMETARVNQKLAFMKPGQKINGLPSWAVN